jgi:hypothetical protein
LKFIFFGVQMPTRTNGYGIGHVLQLLAVIAMDILFLLSREIKINKIKKHQRVGEYR